MHRAYLLLVSLTAGAAALALEVLAARAMAPVLGSGSVAWSALLAVALGMLALGNLTGGLLADRASADAVIAWALTAAAACLVVLSQCYGPALRWAADHALIAGAVWAAAITQAAPLLMLGAITPALLRAGRRDQAEGRWAGLVLAAGSGGGIGGALAAGLLLAPELGLTRSYLLAAVVLTLAAAPAVAIGRRWVVGLLLIATLAAAVLCWSRHRPTAVRQSAYGQLEIVDSDAGRVLLVDGLPQTGMPERLRPMEGLWRGYLLEAALAMRPHTRDALVIGLGAGLAPRLLRLDGVACEAVELDPAVVRIAREEFDFEGPVAVADGRAFLSGTDRRWDLIFLDVCTADRLAWHLFTVEAMAAVRQRLTPNGILVIQFIGDDGPWSGSLVRTVEAVFGSSLVLAPPRRIGGVGPQWLFATRGVPPQPPDAALPPTLPPPWEVVAQHCAGDLLYDDHFPAELAWARTANRWRRLFATGAGRP